MDFVLIFLTNVLEFNLVTFFPFLSSFGSKHVTPRTLSAHFIFVNLFRCDLQVLLCGPKLFVVFTTVHKRRKHWSVDTLTWLPLMLSHQPQFILQRYFKVCISFQYWPLFFVINFWMYINIFDVHNWRRCLTFATLKDEDGNPQETEYGLSTYKDQQTPTGIFGLPKWLLCLFNFCSGIQLFLFACRKCQKKPPQDSCLVQSTSFLIMTW